MSRRRKITYLTNVDRYPNLEEALMNHAGDSYYEMILCVLGDIEEPPPSPAQLRNQAVSPIAPRPSSTMVLATYVVNQDQDIFLKLAELSRENMREWSKQERIYAHKSINNSPQFRYLIDSDTYHKRIVDGWLDAGEILKLNKWLKQAKSLVLQLDKIMPSPYDFSWVVAAEKVGGKRGDTGCSTLARLRGLRIAFWVYPTGKTVEIVRPNVVKEPVRLPQDVTEHFGKTKNLTGVSNPHDKVYYGPYDERNEEEGHCQDCCSITKVVNGFCKECTLRAVKNRESIVMPAGSGICRGCAKVAELVDDFCKECTLRAVREEINVDEPTSG